MGLSRSSVGAGVENGRQKWSMKMVNGYDVGCRCSYFLSCFVESGVLYFFWNFYISIDFGCWLWSLYDFFFQFL